MKIYIRIQENLLGMQYSDFQTPAYCRHCSSEHQKYCHSENLLKDHCCCNTAHHKGEFIDIRHEKSEGLHLKHSKLILDCTLNHASAVFSYYH